MHRINRDLVTAPADAAAEVALERIGHKIDRPLVDKLPGGTCKITSPPHNRHDIVDLKKREGRVQRCECRLVIGPVSMVLHLGLDAHYLVSKGRQDSWWGIVKNGPKGRAPPRRLTKAYKKA